MEMEACLSFDLSFDLSLDGGSGGSTACCIDARVRWTVSLSVLAFDMLFVRKTCSITSEDVSVDVLVETGRFRVDTDTIFRCTTDSAAATEGNVDVTSV